VSTCAQTYTAEGKVERMLKRTYAYKVKVKKSKEENIKKLLKACAALYNMALKEACNFVEGKPQQAGNGNAQQQATSEEAAQQADNANATQPSGKQKPRRFKTQTIFRHLNTRIKEWRPQLQAEHQVEIQFDTCSYLLNTVAAAVARWANGKSGRPREKNEEKFRTIPFRLRRAQLFERNEYGNYFINLPFIGRLKVYYHRPIPAEAKIKIVSLTRKADGYYICVVCEIPPHAVERKFPLTGKAVGIDLGVRNYITLSDGEVINLPPELQRAMERDFKATQRKEQIISRKLQAAREKCQPGEKPQPSRRCLKVQMELAKTHLRMKRRMLHFNHNKANLILSKYDYIFLENIDIKKLKEDCADEGKSNINRKIQQMGWGRLRNILLYKAENAGFTPDGKPLKVVDFVDAAYSSQECYKCGCRVEKTLDVRVHKCPNCGEEIGRDENAAKVILKRGLQKLGMNLDNLEIPPT